MFSFLSSNNAKKQSADAQNSPQSEELSLHELTSAASEVQMADLPSITNNVSVEDLQSISQTYSKNMPEHMATEIAELAALQEEIRSLSTESNSLLGMFHSGSKNEKHADKKSAVNKKSVKAENPDEVEQDTTEVLDVVAEVSDQPITSTAEAVDQAVVAEEKEELPIADKISLLSQVKQVLLQQKDLLKKLAAVGNTPIFKPETINRLLEALPVIAAWQKSGAQIPTTLPPVNQSINVTQPVTTGGAQASVGHESEAQIRNSLGIQTEVAEVPKTLTTNEVNALKSDMANEGFLESTTTMPSEEQSAGAQLTIKDDVFTDTPQLSKKDLAKKEKLEREQEKEWAIEAERRTKEIEKRRKEAEKLVQDQKIGKTKITITDPNKKKVSKMQAFSDKLNYFGLGKKKDEFIENLGVMMDAGLPLLDAMRSLELEAKEKPYKKLLSRIVVAVETGSPLWRAMEATHFFEGQHVSMVKVGEEAGNLVENLRYLAAQSEKQRALRAKVKTAMIYPIIVFVMLTLIIFGLGMFVLPNLIQIIVSLGVPMPFITRMIVLFTNIFQEHGLVLLPSIIVGSIIVLMLHKYTSFKIFSQWSIMKIPGIGVLIRESILSQFGVTMGGLLQAGVPITDALESIASTTPIVKFQKFYILLLRQIKLGDSFSTAFKKIKMTDRCFPGSMQQLIQTGEKSGSLTKIMFKIAEIHEKKATDVAEKLPVILEPMLLLFIGSLVGTIALGVLAPIYSIVGNVGGN